MVFIITYLFMCKATLVIFYRGQQRKKLITLNATLINSAAYQTLFLVRIIFEKASSDVATGKSNMQNQRPRQVLCKRVSSNQFSGLKSAIGKIK